MDSFTQRADKKIKRSRLSLKEISLFAMFGALMFISKLILEFLPNVHMIGMFIVAFTVVYRSRALIPIYVFVFITGLYNGFSTWWIPYLYIWLPLWGVTMLLPKKMPIWIQPVVYCAVSALHGLSYGTLYAPFQAVMYHLSFKGMLAWIAAGFPWDVTHMIGNTVIGCLIVPVVLLLRKLNKAYKIK